MTSYSFRKAKGVGRKNLIRAVAAAYVFSVLSVGIDAIAADNQITLASWNISWLTGTPNDGKHKRKCEDFEMLRKYAKRLDADIIATQEIKDVEGLRKVFGTGYDFHLSSTGGLQRTGFAVRSGIDFGTLPDYDRLNTTGSLRPGAQIEIYLSETKKLRLMSVHLKSGCFSETEDISENEKISDACKKLTGQIGPLEHWVHETTSETDLFVILGDFNRRMLDGNGDRLLDELGQEEDDPEGAWVKPTMQSVKPMCWSQFTQFIDHILVSDQVADLVVQGSFREIQYDEQDKRTVENGRPRHYPSDHCPIKVTIKY